MTTFTSWETELYHHGIKGQKWGIRRYQNEDGTLTAAGRARYGDGEGEGQKYTSAKKIARDYNNLDRGYANAAARFKRANYIGEKLSGKAIKKGKTPEDIATGNGRLSKKMRKTYEQQQKAARDMKSIESMQYRVLAKAYAQNYKITSKEVNRYGSTGAQEAAQLLGGILANIAVAVITKGSTTAVVKGHEIKVHK